MKLTDHRFTMPAPVFGMEDPFFDQDEDGRLPASGDAVTARSPYGPSRQAASCRFAHRPHGAVPRNHERSL